MRNGVFLILLWLPHAAMAGPVEATPSQGLAFKPQTVSPAVQVLNGITPAQQGSNLVAVPGGVGGIIIPPKWTTQQQQQWEQQQQQQQQQMLQEMASLANQNSQFGGAPVTYGVPSVSAFTGNGGSVPSTAPTVNEDYKRAMGSYPGVGTAAGIPGHNCTAADTDRLTCMVCNIYFESGFEPHVGKVMVGETVMTREYSNSYVDTFHSDTACKTVYAKSHNVAQYSWTLENKSHVLPMGGAALEDCIAAAKEAISDGPNGVTNYYNPKLASPAWGLTCQPPSGIPDGRIGNHRFCTINGAQTRSVADVQRSEGISSVSFGSSDGDVTR